MRTQKVTLDEQTYELASINFKVYEEAFFDGDGNLLTLPKGAVIAEASLKNANCPANPPFDEIPAGHVLKLLHTALSLSGLVEKTQGEAPEPENQS